MSLKDAGNTISSIESEFILSSLKTAQRIDGRRLFEYRKTRMSFTRADKQSSCEVQLGRTRVLGVVTAEVIPPFPDRQTEGFLNFNLELSPMASAAFEAGRPSTEAVELTRIVERGIKDSRALDTEALCIIAGEKVWSVRCSIHVLDHGGNLVDAAGLAAIAALQHFRLPQVEVTPSGYIMFDSMEREPMPLSLHHVPICITFGLFNKGDSCVIDPSEREELVMDGRITYSMNLHHELCAVHKIGGTPISTENVVECAQVAARNVDEISKMMNAELKRADEEYQQQRLAQLRGSNYASEARASLFTYESTQKSEKVDFDASAYRDLHVAAKLPEDEPMADTDRRSALLEAMKQTAEQVGVVSESGKSQEQEEAADGTDVQDEFDAKVLELQKAKSNTAAGAEAAGSDDDMDLDLKAAAKKSKEGKKEKKAPAHAAVVDNDDGDMDLTAAIKKTKKKKKKKV